MEDENNLSINPRWLTFFMVSFFIFWLIFGNFIKEGYKILSISENQNLYEVMLTLSSIIGLITIFTILSILINEISIQLFDKKSIRKNIEIEFKEDEYKSLMDKNKRYISKTKQIDDYKTMEQIKKYIKKRVIK